jgi:LysR family transcriptional regulator, glycine cleavage system transcriptional activator
MPESRPKLPSLDLLKGFEAAARHLNFTKAADELYLTQSAVSRQIQQLEEQLGVRLFVRQRRGLQLTFEGERLQRSVQAALRQVEEAVDSLAQRPAGNRVTLTSTMAFCSLWLIPRLGEFNRLFPEVGVRIAANDQVLNLERERIEVSVRYSPAQSAPAGAVWLFDEELVPVCSPALLERTGKPPRRAQDFAHYVLLDLEDPGIPASWLAWGTWLQSAGVRRLKPAGWLAFNYYDQVVRAALAGQGFALGRLPLIADLLRDGSLVAPLDTRARTDHAYWVVQAESARGRPDVGHLVGWIAQTARGPASPAPARITRSTRERP